MIGFLRSLRKLVLGETWVLPAGVGLTVGGAFALREVLAASTWEHLGGFAIAAGVTAVLAASLRIRA